MDSRVKLYLNRAEDEYLLADKDMSISVDNNIKEILGIANEKTFFSSVISHAYYGIFYSAKSYLLLKGVVTSPPEEHKKTYEEFRKMAERGEVDKDLIRIYEIETAKAEVLLEIFFMEKKKRGVFTYNIRSEANMPYAQESLSNAKKFISIIKLIIERGR